MGVFVYGDITLEGTQVDPGQGEAEFETPEGKVELKIVSDSSAEDSTKTGKNLKPSLSNMHRVLRTLKQRVLILGSSSNLVQKRSKSYNLGLSVKVRNGKQRFSALGKRQEHPVIHFKP